MGAIPNRTLAQNLEQRTLDLFETSALWMRKGAMKCHMAGLQGEKRRLRYLYREAQNVTDCLQHSGWDLFDPGLELYPVVGSADISKMMDPESCIRIIIETYWKIHDAAHEIANEMVIGKFKGLSEPVYHYCDCLMNMIGETQRNYRSYEAAGWDWHHVSRHQETDCNIHDKYEGKEEKQGYSDGKES